jgi:hypothetical protein
MSRVYLAGPMSGIADWNFPAFHKVAERLRAEGYVVANPADHFGGDTTRRWDEYLKVAVAAVTICDLLAVLPGWQESKGARLEVFTARSLGIPVLDADTLEPVEGTGSVCLDAYLLVTGDRQAMYGDPFPLYDTVASVWRNITKHDGFDARTVLLSMLGLKLGRYAERRGRDSLVDLTGYAELVGRCERST